MSFDNFSLHPNILEAVAEAGYSEPTKVQLNVIPKIMKGFDIRASAHTGTGKTAAFLLPALHRLSDPSKKAGHGPRILILVPTRELAMQITTQAEKYSKYMRGVKTVCVVGGVPYHAQMRKLSRPYDILVATPGRLIDYIDRRKMDFSRLETLVLDEADRMLDMGFSESVEQIVKATPPSRQTLLFSATLQGSVIKLSERLMDKPMEIIVHGGQAKPDNIIQKLHYVDNLHHKNRLLDHILNEDDVDYAIVFTSTKRHASQLVMELQEKGYQAAALHGDMNQRQRTRTITQLRNGKIKVLVATDVAARGIDVQSITHVINFDLPNSAEDYVHRIGRTGRAGAKGTALSFAAGHDAFMLQKIEKFTGQRIEIAEIAGLEPRAKQRPSPRSKRPHSRPGANRRFDSRAKSPKGRVSRPRKARA
ncbi:MAG: ATP-dependent RNA helicase RhlE [Chlamydiae bacterium]|nr:ATP-dependent RNA helicase RhlE [Chlamydiota bacterium]